MLRSQATNIGTSAVTIPGVSANGLNNTIRNLNLASGELRRVGFQYAREFSARFKRMDFERDINASRRNILESDALFKADRYMRRNPGRYETATQRINAVDKLKQLTHPFAAKMEMYRELYGGDAEIIQKAEADELYRSHIKEVRDPVGARRDALSAKFGGGPRGNILAINAMRAEADELYRKDMLSDYDKHFEDLTERYGGDENKAESAYKKELSKNLPKFFKDSKMSSKSLYNLSRGFSALKGAGGVVSTVAGVASGITEKIIGGADDANKRSVGIENLMNLTGGLSKVEIAAGELAGMSVEQILKTKQKLTLKFGNIQTALKVISDAGAGEDAESRMFLYEALGVDETELAWADIYNQSGRIDPTTEHRKKVARLEEEKYRGMLLRRSGSGFWSTIKGMSPDSWAARSEDEDFNMIVAGLASAPPQPTVYSAGTDGGTTNVAVNFNGPINVSSDDPEEFAAEAVRTGASERNIGSILDTMDPRRR